MLRRGEALGRKLRHHRLRRRNRRGGASKLGFKTTEGPDIVSFRVNGKALDANWGQGGQQAVQSEGAGKPTAEDRGRLLVGLPNDRTCMSATMAAFRRPSCSMPRASSTLQ